MKRMEQLASARELSWKGMIGRIAALGGKRKAQSATDRDKAMFYMGWDCGHAVGRDEVEIDRGPQPLDEITRQCDDNV